MIDYLKPCNVLKYKFHEAFFKFFKNLLKDNTLEYMVGIKKSTLEYRSEW